VFCANPAHKKDAPALSEADGRAWSLAKHFQSAMEQIEGIAVSNWPQHELVFDNAETLSV
jgi:hypothetical protein